jgi:hypothetical protein
MLLERAKCHPKPMQIYGGASHHSGGSDHSHHFRHLTILMILTIRLFGLAMVYPIDQTPRKHTVTIWNTIVEFLKHPEPLLQAQIDTLIVPVPTGCLRISCQYHFPMSSFCCFHHHAHVLRSESEEAGCQAYENSLQVRECVEEVSSPRGSPVAATKL